MKFSKLNIDGKINIQGLPVLQIYGDATLGADITLTSSPHFNPAGSYKTMQQIYIKENAHLSIGKSSGLSGVTVVCWNNAFTGKNFSLGANVTIWDTDFHGIYFKNRCSFNFIKTAPVHIGDDVWNGDNSTILKGVSIGNESTIGAGSLVNKDIPSDEIWAENPAKFIRKIIV